VDNWSFVPFQRYGLDSFPLNHVDYNLEDNDKHKPPRRLRGKPLCQQARSKARFTLAGTRRRHGRLDAMLARCTKQVILLFDSSILRGLKPAT